MIWLASFPRSGNTFLRNVLFEVYGLRSSTFHRESAYPLDEGYQDYPFVKTHEQPSTLESEGFHSKIPAVYLVRDGRDVMCSLAHHTLNLVEPGTDFCQNLTEAIVAQRGSFFGGWSANVEAWIERADLFIRYEDLVTNPLKQLERIGNLIELPPAHPDKLPSFESQKFGIPEYGARRHQNTSEEVQRQHAEKFFHRGRSGSWKEEMPEELQELFWSYHGDTMDRLGYTRNGDIADPHRDLDFKIREKLDYETPTPTQKYRILMEANKLVSDDNDGVKRYQVSLLREMYPITQDPRSRWTIDLYSHGKIMPLANFHDSLFGHFTRTGIESTREALSHKPLDQEPKLENPDIPPNPGIFIRLERRFMVSIPRGFVNFLQRHDVTALHDTYEFFRAIVSWLALIPTVAAGIVRDSINSLLARHSRETKTYDLIHIPLQQNFKAFKRNRTPKLITIHDLTHLLFPNFHTSANTRNAEKGMKFAVSSGAHLIAVSEATKADLLEHSPVPSEKITRIYEAADPVIFHRKTNHDDCLTVRKKYGLNFKTPYIVCLSTLEPRKNLENTIRGYLNLLERDPSLDVNLVIAGKRGWDADGIYELAAEREDRIYFTGFVDDEDLAYLYSGALCLSYLSYYEGFGLPPLEAMRCGTPVVFADNSAIREVVAAGGLPADPSDPNNICDQYLRLVQDSRLRQEKADAALQRANQFSWRNAAIETLALYERLIDSK